jgi:GntR family transcriptional regulator
LNDLHGHMKLDFRSGVPIYTQITDQINQMVATGILKPGDQLPTVRQLATELRINFNTVARAYRILDKSGLISTQQGRGTYIWATPDEETNQQLRRDGLESLTGRCLSEAARLGYTPEEVAAMMHQQIQSWQESNSLPEHS